MDPVDRIRRFNRRWTTILGLLDRGLLETDLSLAEARVLFELGHGAGDLKEKLGMDASFLTRVLKGLEEQGLVASARSGEDRRRVERALTPAGVAALRELDARSSAQIRDLLAPLTADQRAWIAEAVTLIPKLIRPEPSAKPEITTRDLAPGDLGWVVMRHGALYAAAYGWDRDFEAMVAGLVAEFHARGRTGRDRAWIVEVDGVRAGCVFCVARDAETAQLRMLLVEPWARGQGIGRALVEGCVGFARDAGYARIRLWTNASLVSARRIYEGCGFEPRSEARLFAYGQAQVEQVWERPLR